LRKGVHKKGFFAYIKITLKHTYKHTRTHTHTHTRVCVYISCLYVCYCLWKSVRTNW